MPQTNFGLALLRIVLLLGLQILFSDLRMQRLASYIIASESNPSGQIAFCVNARSNNSVYADIWLGVFLFVELIECISPMSMKCLEIKIHDIVFTVNLPLLVGYNIKGNSEG